LAAELLRALRSSFTASTICVGDLFDQCLQLRLAKHKNTTEQMS